MNASLFEIVEYTHRSIFLTGKAGTGKTTFLNEFVKKTKKKNIIVAPTGIAAINAGGVTIHSMFGLPLRTFIPTVERIDQTSANNIQDLMPHLNKYKKNKIKLLREIEIIIIDEASMLRADVLDMMDFALRHVRRNPLPFGGVQMLFIGDLYQLPPVVRDHDLLQKYYPSPFFFDSFSLKNLPLITLELTKIYRQEDENFIALLNAIRDGNIKAIDFELLNKRYNPNFEPDKNAYVHLCSHNKTANQINQLQLAALKTPSFFFKADVIGTFNENQYPNEEILELKKGAQIMFIRNDTSPEKKYYNGKLAEIVELNDKEIWVRMEDDEETFSLKKEIWEQKNYSLDEEKNIKEEVLGSFQQFPIRLAWAITIHKSQGLTFDRLIIDAGNSFASGQVYVALSRCRTLEGIVLKSKITPEVIYNDKRLQNFELTTHANEKMEGILESEKYDYSIHKLLQHTDTRWLTQALLQWYASASTSKKLDTEKAKQLYDQLKIEANSLNATFNKFEKFIQQKVKKYADEKEDWDGIVKKAKGAVHYFFMEIKNKIFENLKQFYAETKGVKGLKQYNEEMMTLLSDTEDYLQRLKELYLMDMPLFEETNETKVSKAIAKLPSHVETFKLFEEGYTIMEISKKRNLVKETIFGHLAKYAEMGLLNLERIISKEKISHFEDLFRQSATSEKSLKEWKDILPEDFEYYEIRLLKNHFTHQSEKEVD